MFFQDIKQIANWMNIYKKNAHSKGYVIGLSGGVDSAVVAAIAVKAVGCENVHGVIMPIVSEPGDAIDAERVAIDLGITYDIVDLTSAFVAMDLACPVDRRDEVLMKSNIKSRLRMTMLYQFANELNYLVAGTGNRSEDAVGYFTKYGDGGVDILPIGQYYKSEVRMMAKELGLDMDIVNRISTAGLFEGQTDEEDLGITYDELDKILQFIDGRSDSLVNFFKMEKVITLINRHKHKREYPPIFQRY